VSSLDHRISLRVASSDELASQAILVLEKFLDFCSELASSIHDNFSWPWVSIEPDHLEDVGNLIRSLRWDFSDLEPSGCGINHGEAMKSGYTPLVLRVADSVWTYQVDT
jgi:hypothetical protein